MTLVQIYNTYLDALGIPEWTGYAYPPRQAEQIVNFLAEHDPGKLAIFARIAEEFKLESN